MSTFSPSIRGGLALVAACAFACGPVGCIASSDSQPDDETDTHPSAVSQAPSEKQLASQGYVRTPAGFYHHSCVHELLDDDTIEQDTRTIVHANGKRDQVDLCAHPIYRSSSSTVTMLPDDGTDPDLEGLVPTTSGSDAPDATTDGYKELGSFTAGHAIREIKATWTVPPAPKNVAGQTIFLFPGLEPVTGVRILQPVLQFGPSAAGGGNRWDIASWSCGNPCFHTGVKHSAAGHVIKGNVAGSQCSDGACDRWDIGTYDTTNGNHTVLSTFNDPHHYRWTFGGALEVYGVSHCSQYPDAAATRLHDIGVYNMALNRIGTDWGKFIASSTPTGCGFGVSWSNANHWVKLSY